MGKGTKEGLAVDITTASEPSLQSLQINLFGGVRVGDKPVAGDKAARLLAFLALHPTARHSREMLADLLWPALSPDRARRSLSDLLYRLRRLLGSDGLITDARFVSLNRSILRTDVAEFWRLSEAADEASLKKAIAQYSAPLAPELYDDWILARRVSLHERYLDTLERLAKAVEARGQFDAALAYFQRMAEAEPLREPAHRGIMRNLARLHRPALALDAYSRLEKLLDEELGVHPAPETQELAQQIRSELNVSPGKPGIPDQLPLIGRVEERAVALEKVESAIAGRGRALALEGPAGIGKSRLWEEITSGARWRGATVVHTWFSEYPTGQPLASLADLLDQALRGPRAAQVELLLPAETLAAVGELYPPWRNRAALPDLPSAQAGQRMRQSLLEVFRALAGLSPLVVVMDDIQWAAPAMWDILELWLPALSATRILVGLAYRRTELESRGEWSLLQKWERDGQLTVMSLGPLEAEAIASALPRVYHAEAPIIAASSGGNPFFITQALFSLSEGASPTGADRVVQQRLGALAPVELEALSDAAVIGVDVPFQLWTAVTGLDPATLVGIVDRLVAHSFLEPVERGYVFSHEIIQEIVYAAIPDNRRRASHKRAAASLREVSPENVHALAFHYERGGNHAEAAAAHRAAGLLDMETFSFRDALAAFEHALELWPDAPSSERASTLFDIVAICDSIGDRPRQASALSQALAESRHLENDSFVLRALIGLGRLAGLTGRIEEAEGYLEEAIDQSAHVADGQLRFEAYFYSGDVAARRGRPEIARELFQRALAQAREIDAPLDEARALRGLSIAARLSGDLERAMSLIEEALVLQTANGDLYGASVTYTNQLAVLYELGAWDRMLALIDEALTLKEKLGDRHGAAIMHHMKGLAAYSLGNYAGARSALTAALSGLEAVEDRRTAGLARNVLGLVAEGEGQLDEAQTYFEAAIASAEATGATTEAAYARLDLGALLVRSGRNREAIPLLEAARTTWRKTENELLRLKSEAWLGLALLAHERDEAHDLASIGWAVFRRGIPKGESPQAWLWALHQLLLRLGRLAEARTALRAAYTELQRQAGAIRDPIQRSLFFQRVSLNHDIVAAYEQITGNPRQITRPILSVNAPFGKLTDDDYIMVSWTLSSAEDELIPSPTKRRRHVLLRLLGEAAEQNAAPTDDDLAAALGVSRRTVLRDIQILIQQGYSVQTRRRK